MTVKFHGILAGIAVGSTGVDSHALVNDPAFFVMKRAEAKAAVGCVAKGSSILQGTNPAGNGGAVVAGKTDDANGGDYGAGRNGGDGM